jgi:hypothetical protein
MEPGDITNMLLLVAVHCKTKPKFNKGHFLSKHNIGFFKKQVFESPNCGLELFDAEELANVLICFSSFKYTDVQCLLAVIKVRRVC